MSCYSFLRPSRSWPPPRSSHDLARGAAGRLMVRTFWEQDERKHERLPLTGGPGWSEGPAHSPWVVSDSACRRVLPESSHPAAGGPPIPWAALWSPCKKGRCPCSGTSCGSRTGRPPSAAAPGGSSAGCERWCSAAEPQLVQPELLLQETNGDTTSTLHKWLS